MVLAARYHAARTKPRCAHLTAQPRTSNIAAYERRRPRRINQGRRHPVVELESELEALLVEYGSLSRAWPKEQPLRRQG